MVGRLVLVCAFGLLATHALVTAPERAAAAVVTPLSVADVSVVEGTGVGTTTLGFVVSTPMLALEECGFRAVLTHGTTNNADFVTGPLLFDVTAVWDTNDQDIPRTFTIARDATFEPNETATLTITGDLAHPTPCAIGDGVATGTITNDDPLLPLSVADATVTEGTGAGTTSLSFVVSTPMLQVAECGYRAVLTHVTTNNADFTSTAFFDVTAVWDTDDQNIPRMFTIAWDAVFEQNETMTLTITGNPLHANPCAIGDGVATGTITNDDPSPPLLSVGDVTVGEGSGAGTTSLVFTVSTPAPQPVTCGFRAVLSHGTTNTADLATAPVFFDVTAVFTTLHTTRQLIYNVTRDPVFEQAETMTMTITGNPAHPFPCQIGDGVAIGTITNDDPVPPLLSVADVTVTEGSGAGTTSLVFAVSSPAAQPFACGFRAVLTHGATNDTDFTSTANFDVAGVFAPNDTTLQRSFGVAQDAVYEQDETATLTITGDPSHPIPCEIGDGVATGTITNDDFRRLGHTHVYWRTHLKQWPARYTPRRPLTRVGFVAPRCAGFRRLDLVRPRGTDTLLQALRYRGGSGLTGKGRLLMRAAAAGLLNESTYGREYTGYANVRALTTAVNRTLATCNPRAYTALTAKLSRWNQRRP